MNKRSLGSLIRKLRKAKGLSLRKLAKQVDVSFVNIAHIENGRVVTSKKVLKQIAHALNYNLDKLLAVGNKVDDDIEKIIRKRPWRWPTGVMQWSGIQELPLLRLETTTV